MYAGVSPLHMVPGQTCWYQGGRRAAGESGGPRAEMEGLAELGSNSTAVAQSAHSRTYLFRPNNTHLRLLDKPAMLIYPCPSGRRSKARRDSAGETRGKGFSMGTGADACRDTRSSASGFGEATAEA